MSNDTNYRITIEGPYETVDSLLKYLKAKKKLWQKYQRQLDKLSGDKYDAAFKTAMKKAGAKKPADLVTWGFNVTQRPKKRAGQVQVDLHTWANENAFNTPISGKNGELARLQTRFPDIVIIAHFDDEYGSGPLSDPPKFEKEYDEEYDD